MQPRLELHLRRVLGALERLWVIAVMESGFRYRLEAVLSLAFFAVGSLGAVVGAVWLLTLALEQVQAWLIAGSVLAFMLYFLEWLKDLLPPRR